VANELQNQFKLYLNISKKVNLDFSHFYNLTSPLKVQELVKLLLKTVVEWNKHANHKPLQQYFQLAGFFFDQSETTNSAAIVDFIKFYN